MATEVLVTIDPSGSGDYTSLQAAVTAEQTDLVSVDEILIFQYEGDWSGAPDVEVGFFGTSYTSNATNYIEFRTDLANRHAGEWDDTKARTVSSSNVITTVNYIRIVGLQVECTGTGKIIRLFQGPDALVQDCFCRGRSIEIVNDTAYVFNTIVTDGTEPINEGIESTNSISYAVNCTVGSTGARECYVGNLECTNCVGYIGNDVVGANCFQVGITGDYNASYDNTAPGANSVINITNPFVDLANGNLRINSTDTQGILEGGTSTGAPDVDIVGTNRTFTTTPDIGAFQITEPPPVLAITQSTIMFGTSF